MTEKATATVADDLSNVGAHDQFVLVRVTPKATDRQTASGLFVPETVRDDSDLREGVSLSTEYDEEYVDGCMTRQRLLVEEGDTVYFRPGKQYDVSKILKETGVLLVALDDIMLTVSPAKDGE